MGSSLGFDFSSIVRSAQTAAIRSFNIKPKTTSGNGAIVAIAEAAKRLMQHTANSGNNALVFFGGAGNQVPDEIVENFRGNINTVDFEEQPPSGNVLFSRPNPPAFKEDGYPSLSNTVSKGTLSVKGTIAKSGQLTPDQQNFVNNVKRWQAHGYIKPDTKGGFRYTGRPIPTSLFNNMKNMVSALTAKVSTPSAVSGLGSLGFDLSTITGLISAIGTSYSAVTGSNKPAAPSQPATVVVQQPAASSDTSTYIKYGVIGVVGLGAVLLLVKFV